jgi:UrcA family protein
MNSIVTMRRAALGVVLLSSGLAAVALANSDRGTASSQVQVEYSDLDLSKPEAAEILYRRITTAARRACEEPTVGRLNHMTRYRECYQSAVAKAVANVNANTLTALHREKTQRSSPG